MKVLKLLYRFAEYRGLGSSLTTAFSYVCAFVGVKTFVDLRESLGLHGIFWTYAIISAFGFLFSLAFVPETKGLNLDEMMPKTSILTASNSVNSQANSEATSTTSRSSATSVTSTSSTDEPCHSSSSSRYVWNSSRIGFFIDIYVADVKSFWWARSFSMARIENLSTHRRRFHLFCCLVLKEWLGIWSYLTEFHIDNELPNYHRFTLYVDILVPTALVLDWKKQEKQLYLVDTILNSHEINASILQISWVYCSLHKCQNINKVNPSNAICLPSITNISDRNFPC